MAAGAAAVISAVVLAVAALHRGNREVQWKLEKKPRRKQLSEQ